MRKVNGNSIIAIRRGGVSGHVVRSRSGVKIASFHGPDSLRKAVEHAHRRADHRREG